MKYLTMFLCAALVLSCNQGEALAASAAIHNGSKVAFDYTLTVDGNVMDSSQGRGPLEYTQGDGKLIAGLTKQLEGMSAGEERTIVLSPAEAYGEPDPRALKEVPISTLPPGIQPKAGMPLQGKDANGNVFIAKIRDVKKDTVMMDFNHPLAGKTLTFKVKIVSVK